MISQEIITKLQPFVSENRQQLIQKIVDQRTRHISLVFEDIDKPHNISAVLRTAEIMGVQDLHFIKNKQPYSVNPDIVKGATKWLTLNHYDSAEGEGNILLAYADLRSRGYKIYATSLGEGAVAPIDIDTDEKVAIVFGTEGTGISNAAAEQADELVQIPMRGFTESFNLSVSAAIILNTLFRNEKDCWGLSDPEKEELIAEWYRRSVREADKILALDR